MFSKILLVSTILRSGNKKEDPATMFSKKPSKFFPIQCEIWFIGVIFLAALVLSVLLVQGETSFDKILFRYPFGANPIVFMDFQPFPKRSASQNQPVYNSSILPVRVWNMGDLYAFDEQCALHNYTFSVIKSFGDRFQLINGRNKSESLTIGKCENADPKYNSRLLYCKPLNVYGQPIPDGFTVCVQILLGSNGTQLTMSVEIDPFLQCSFNMDPQCRLKPYPGQVALFIHPGNLTVAEYEQEQKRKQKEDLQRKSELVGYVMGGVLVGCILIVIVVGIVGYLWYQRRWINYLRQESKPSSLEEHHEMYEEIHSQKVDRMELSDE